MEDIVPRLIQRKEIGAATSRHSGPYSAEEPTVAALHRFIVDHGLKMRGLHHEIYLSDPGRTAPENMKTIIRQPVE